MKIKNYRGRFSVPIGGVLLIGTKCYKSGHLEYDRSEKFRKPKLFFANTNYLSPKGNNDLH